MLWKNLIIIFSILFAILFYRAYIVFTPDRAIFQPCSTAHDNHSLEFNAQRLRTFQKLLQFQTISYELGNQSLDELRKCRDFIKQEYRDIIEKYSRFLHLHHIAEYSLLFEIKGTNSSRKPFLFSAHMDVVPAGNLDRWKYPPFDAYSDGESIYARGTLDDK